MIIFSAVNIFLPSGYFPQALEMPGINGTISKIPAQKESNFFMGKVSFLKN